MAVESRPAGFENEKHCGLLPNLPAPRYRGRLTERRGFTPSLSVGSLVHKERRRGRSLQDNNAWGTR